MSSVVAKRFLFDQQEATTAGFKGQFVLGTDEVGRGSLIGPVVAAAVCFPNGARLKGKGLERWAEQFPWLQDSKTLKAVQREAMQQVILPNALVCVGVASQQEVESLNVQRASLLACWRSVQGVLRQLQQNNGALTREKPFFKGSAEGLLLPVMEQTREEGGDDSLSRGEAFLQQVLILIDGRHRLPQWAGAQRAVVKGDNHSASIAAAAIVAKQWRDAWVQQQCALYPAYGWESNMGYATAKHKARLQQLGASPLHRSTFQW
jgi:ribonuclease HII